MSEEKGVENDIIARKMAAATDRGVQIHDEGFWALTGLGV
jgi:hypothetical protein